MDPSYEALKAQVAESAARLAASAAEGAARLAASEAESAALRAALRVALQASEAARRPPAAAPWRAAPTFTGVAAALRPQLSTLAPPSRASEIAGCPAEPSFCARPLTPALAGLSAAASLEEWRGKSAAGLLREASARPASTKHLPAWVEAVPRGAAAAQGSLSAAALYLRRGSSGAAPRFAMPGVRVPWDCLPELPTRPRQPFHPAFCGGIASDHHQEDAKFDELATCALLALLGSFFQGMPPDHRRFFRAPPLAYALAAFAHGGYLVCVEWVGRLRVTVVSQPFFLGSAEHAAAVAALPDNDLSSALVDLPVEGMQVAALPEHGSRHVLWRVSPPAPGASSSGGGGGGGGGGSEPPAPSDPRFFKILRSEGFSEAYFCSLHAVYTALAAARAAGAGAGGSDPPPPALLPAELLYGAGEVCVLMPWARGREARGGGPAGGRLRRGARGARHCLAGAPRPALH